MPATHKPDLHCDASHLHGRNFSRDYNSWHTSQSRQIFHTMYTVF